MHYIALVTDPALHNDVLVFSVRERGARSARRAILHWYNEHGWPPDGIVIRLVVLRQNKDVQYIGHASAEKDVEAIRRLCEEVLHIASDEPTTSYAEKLRDLVQAFDIGKKTYQDRDL